MVDDFPVEGLLDTSHLCGDDLIKFGILRIHFADSLLLRDGCLWHGSLALMHLAILVDTHVLLVIIIRTVHLRLISSN